MRDLDSAVCLHLEVALRSHRVRVERDGGAVPELVHFLERLVRFRVTQGQSGSLFDVSAEAPDDRGVTQRVLTYRQAADALACSESTVKRLVATGQLKCVHVLGAARIRVDDLDGYVGNLSSLGEPA